MNYTVSFIYRDFRGHTHVIDIRVNPYSVGGRHHYLLDMIETGVNHDEWDV